MYHESDLNGQFDGLMDGMDEEELDRHEWVMNHFNKGIKMPKNKKPLSIKVGNHLIDPNDVSCISKIRSKKLYIVRLKSQPNMEFPIWVNGNEINSLIDYFEIKEEDIQESEE